MEISVTIPGSPSSITLSVVKKLGGGGQVSIYQVRSNENNTVYVLKLFPKTEAGTYSFLKENLISELSHPNVVKNFPINYNSKEFHGILLEYVLYGDFIDIIKKDILDEEILVRTYFHQLIEGLQHIHSKGIAHLDIKLENITLSSDFTLKIIDFDNAQLTKSRTLTTVGTEYYRAPEVIDQSCIDFKAADIFSTGVLLYALRVKEFPFSEMRDPACKNIRSYQSLVNNKDNFWIAKKKSKRGHLLDDDFIELINGMLHIDPVQRFTIQDIKNSKWYLGEALVGEDLANKMRPRIERLMEKRNKAHCEKKN